MSAPAPDGDEAEIPVEVRTFAARIASVLIGQRRGAERSRRRTRSLGLRTLGAVYFCAFASWYSQQMGLIGSQGIMPAADYLNRASEALGGPSFFQVPTVLWYFRSDAALSATAIFGMVAAASLTLGLFPLVSTLGCWLLYLSLSSVGGVFMHYQWDALLLEAGLMALFACPLSLTLSRARHEPHPISSFLFRWLLFRLMFLSGWVKLASHDPTWRDLTALTYHYWSQPLPTWTAWLVDGAPRSFHVVAAALLFATELVCPFFLFAPRRLRLWLAFVPLVALQLIILATGNYGFFNLLTITLCLFALDDDALAWAAARIRRRPFVEPSQAAPPPVGIAAVARHLALGCALVFVLTVTTTQMAERLTGGEAPAWLATPINSLAPFRSLSNYGLFASMTTERLEIGVEGSDDGVNWRAYRFAWKPGPLYARPRFATAHMPRLDWQMWFAALGTCQQNPWFRLFLKALLDGRPPVLKLLANNPFEDHPPRYLRTPLSSYRFTSAARLRTTGEYWQADAIGEYCPPVTLEGGVMKRAALP